MAQVTTGIRSVLAHPAIYDLSQTVFGATRSREILVREYIQVPDFGTILDIGCGTGEIVPFLPKSVAYWGFDLSADYIRAARKRHGDRGRFECADVGEHAVGDLASSVDVVIAVGVLHHVDDGTARSLVESAHASLKDQGRLVTMDPVFAEGQSRISRNLVSRDRGMNVRSPDGYRNLVENRFTSVDVTVRHNLLRFPYSHCIMECTKSTAS